jgi:hypothetical protein
VPDRTVGPILRLRHSIALAVDAVGREMYGFAADPVPIYRPNFSAAAPVLAPPAVESGPRHGEAPFGRAHATCRGRCGRLRLRAERGGIKTGDGSIIVIAATDDMGLKTRRRLVRRRVAAAPVKGRHPVPKCIFVNAHLVCAPGARQCRCRHGPRSPCFPPVAAVLDQAPACAARH